MRTVWLASYPKSGNTWFRMLIANLSATEQPVDINDPPLPGGIASGRDPFEHLTLINSGLLSYDEADCMRPRVYEALARGEHFEDTQERPLVRFTKCHDAYTRTAKGEPLLAGADGADGAILIVRDPRAVAASLASHNGISVDAAITAMARRRAVFGGRTASRTKQFRQHLLGWSGHAESWLTQTDIPVHLARYEDMKTDAAGALRGALAFAGHPATETEIARAAAFSDFSELKKQESEKGFCETPKTAAAFFRRGEAEAWREELTPEQIARIEAGHGPMMRRLGYTLSYAPATSLECAE